MLQKFKPKSEFSRNVLTLLTGTTVAQAIPIAVSPILTRIYTPENFGVFALFTSITMIFGTIANARYETAIMLPRKNEDAINIFALAVIISTLISLTLLLIVILFNDAITKLFNNSEIGLWLYFVPLSVFFTGFFNAINFYNNRIKNYQDIRNSTIVKSVVQSMTQVILGFFKSGTGGLVSGQILSLITANYKLFKNIFKDKKLISKISIIKMIAVAKRYKKFPQFEIWSALFNTTSSYLPTLLLTVFFGSSIAGFYSISNRILVTPASLIGKTTGQVYLQRSAGFKRDSRETYQITKRVFEKLFLLGILPMSLIGAYGDYIFSIVFGNNWTIAGEYARILSPWLFLVFVISPISSLVISMEKQKEFFLFNLTILIFRTLALLSGFYIFHSALYAILLFSIVGTFFWFLLMLYIFRLAGIKIRELKKLFFMGFALTVILLSSRLLI
jgi:O-antigen/teichoic acid export membrane protein